MTDVNNARKNDGQEGPQGNGGVHDSAQSRAQSARTEAGSPTPRPRQGNRRTVALVVCLVALVALIAGFATVQARAAVSRHQGYRVAEQSAGQSQPAGEPSASDATSAASDSSATAQSSASQSADPIDWRKASGGAYPDLSQVQDLSIQVSLADQRVYIKDGDSTIYTMICSSGMDDSTPRGTFAVQSRGENFFNTTENMGANWWVSFSGDYLFHTVPTDSDGNYIVSEAEKLGRPASHGCLRLTVSDAKWIYDNIPDGTTVDIA